MAQPEGLYRLGAAHRGPMRRVPGRLLITGSGGRVPPRESRKAKHYTTPSGNELRDSRLVAAFDLDRWPVWGRFRLRMMDPEIARIEQARYFALPSSLPATAARIFSAVNGSRRMGTSAGSLLSASASSVRRWPGR